MQLRAPVRTILNISNPPVARVGRATEQRAAAAGGGEVIDLGEVRRSIAARDRWRYQRGAQALLSGERVELCQRALNAGRVGVALDQSNGCAHFTGVISCGSVWHCPICADKITNERRRDMQTAIAAHKKNGGECYLLTFTFPHEVTLPLQAGVDAMQEAQKKMKATRAYKNLMEDTGTVGTIKATEVTHGVNGWHPHVHMLVLARVGVLDQLEAARALWGAAVELAGLGKINEHGFDARGGDYAADYVAKFGKEPSDATRAAVNAWWSVSHEMTRAAVKVGERMKGDTPFTLLRRYVLEHDARAGALFREYAEVFKGRRQLHFSPGLKARLDLFELERTRKKKKPPLRLLSLDGEQWSAVLRHNARWEVLYTVEHYGAAAAGELIARMVGSRGRWSGRYHEIDPYTGARFEGYADYAARAA